MKYSNRLVAWVLAIFIIFSFTTLFIAIFNYNEDKKSILKSRMECYADVVARSSGIEEAKRLLPDDIRITIMNLDGMVMADSKLSAEEMGPHQERPEVMASLKDGDSYLIRQSSTLGGEHVYFAKKYEYFIVRVSQFYTEKQKNFMLPDWSLIVSLNLLLILSVLAVLYLSKRYRKLELLKKEKDTRNLKHELTMNISHELKTPVSSLQGYLETIINHPEMDQERRQLYIERAFIQSMRLADIIADITTVTKLEESPGQYKTSMVNIKLLFDGIIDELSLGLDEHRISVDNQLEPLSIKASHNLLYAIFRNLLENTIKYGGDGCSVKISSKRLAGGVCEIDYHDTGKGVPDEVLGKIFDRFYRMNSDRASGKEGSGLGLSIMRNAVIVHKGMINAYHVPGGGLGFRFTLQDLQ